MDILGAVHVHITLYSSITTLDNSPITPYYYTTLTLQVPRTFRKQTRLSAPVTEVDSPST